MLDKMWTKITHGTSWDVETQCDVSDMFDIHWCRTRSMNTFHLAQPLPILSAKKKEQIETSKNQTIRSTKHWGIRLARPNATCLGHPCWPITKGPYFNERGGPSEPDQDQSNCEGGTIWYDTMWNEKPCYDIKKYRHVGFDIRSGKIRSI